MSSPVYASALNKTMDEIRKICPEVLNAFVFRGEDLIASDTSSKKTTPNAVVEFNLIEKEAKTVGGLKSIKIEGTKRKINLNYMENFNLATVLSNKADENYVNTLTSVLVPTVIKLASEIKILENDDELNKEANPRKESSKENIEIKNQIPEESSNKELSQTDLIEPPANEEVEVIENQDIEQDVTENLNTQVLEEKSPIQLEEEEFLAEPPVTQLIVETLSGFLVPSDTVRIDKEIIEKWNELYEGKTISLVHIEAVNGKNTQSKFRNIKSSKYAGKSVIRIPEKIQADLEISKGELVTIKPVIEWDEN